MWNGTSRGLRKGRIMVAFKHVNYSYTILNTDPLQLDIMEWDMLIGSVCKDRHWTLVVRALQSMKCKQLHLQVRDKTRMDPNRIKETVNSHKSLTKHKKYTNQRRASNFVLKGK